MSNLDEINLADLTARYLENTEAREAVLALEGKWEGRESFDLPTLLRHHGEAPVVKPVELRLRRAFDELLGFYSLMEVACLAGFVPTPLPDEFGGRAAAHLKNEFVGRYYVTNYPLLLPQLLRLRLDGRNRLVEAERALAGSLFQQFLEVSALLEADEAKTLLWFLEDGYQEKYNLQNTFEALESPWSLTTRLLKPASWRNPVDESLLGLARFLGFARQLAALLRRSRDCPLLASAMWHYHAYWFDQLERNLELRKPATKLDAALEILHLKRGVSVPPAPRTAQPLHKVLAELREARYGFILSTMLALLQSDSGPALLDSGWRSYLGEGH